MLAFCSLALFNHMVNRKMGSCWYPGLIWEDIAIKLPRAPTQKVIQSQRTWGSSPFTATEADSAPHCPDCGVSPHTVQGQLWGPGTALGTLPRVPPRPFSRLGIKATPGRELQPLRVKGNSFSKEMYPKEVGWVKCRVGCDGTREAEEREGK